MRTIEERDRMTRRILHLDDDDDRDERSGKVSHGNTRLPYGLCAEFNINTEGFSPEDCWKALEGKGVKAKAAYKALKNDKNIKPYIDKVKKEDDKSTPNKGSNGASEDDKSATDHKPKFNKTLPVCAARTLKEVAEYQAKHLGVRCDLKKTTDVELANVLTNSMADAFEYAPKIKNTTFCCMTYNAAKIKEAFYPAFAHYYHRANPWMSPQSAMVKAKQSVKLQRVPSNAIAQYNCFYDPPWQFNDEEVKLYNEGKKYGTGIMIIGNYGSSLKELDKSARSAAEEGYHPKGCNTAKSFFDHEVMHAITAAYHLTENPKIKDYIKQNKSKVETELAEYPTKYTNAETFRDEVLSEAWAECLNSSNPRPMARDLGKMIWEAIQNDKD